MPSERYGPSSRGYRCSVDGCWREQVLSYRPMRAAAPGQLHGGYATYLSGFCDEHGCSIDMCPNASDGDSPFCDEHRCWSGGCNLASMAAMDEYGGSRACHDHTCRVGGCLAICTLDGLHCDHHACPRKGCPNPRDPLSQACKDHSCALDNCPRERKCRRGSEACSAHTCRESGCYRAVIVQKQPQQHQHQQQQLYYYCEDHACHWAAKPCLSLAPPGSDFCDNHRCVVVSCPSACRRTSRFCADHGCWFDGAECANGPLRYGRFCAAHSCHSRHCLEAVVPPARFCRSHACAWSFPSAPFSPAPTARAASPHSRPSTPSPSPTFSNPPASPSSPASSPISPISSASCSSNSSPPSSSSSAPVCAGRRHGDAAFCEAHACTHRGCLRPREQEHLPLCTEHERLARQQRKAKEEEEAAAARSASALVERTRRDEAALASGGLGTGAATAGFVPVGHLVRLFREDARAVYAMAFVQGWEGRGGRERYDRMRAYLDRAMEVQLQLWSLEAGEADLGPETPPKKEGEPAARLALQDPASQKDKAESSVPASAAGTKALPNSPDSPAGSAEIQEPTDSPAPSPARKAECESVASAKPAETLGAAGSRETS